jgi:MoaA/NifB/PqqE/SkfB family radical SAM enzyme
MKGSGSLRRSLALLRDPATAEKRRILAERWAGLDPALRLPGQGLGQKATGCGATIGIQPRCDFACTGCYLGHEANHIPALSTAAILRQLDEMRRWLGPKSNVQITDGEVTLRPVEELVEILSYAHSIGVIPMVMTHGDNFRRQPGLLERLMAEGGLTEVSIHVDITQRGRDGHKAPKSELELMGLREEFAGMVREARRRTGRTLRAAMTLTVTQGNLPQISDVVRWLIHNRDAFSLVSFQPLAQVGRTRKSQHGVTADELWTEIAKATADFGLTLRGAGPMHFGHTDCTRFVPLLTLERPGGDLRAYQFIRDEPEDIAIMAEFFSRGLGGMAFRDDRPLEMVGRALGFARTDPRWLLGPVRRWAAGRFRTEAGMSLGRLLVDSLRGKVRLGGFTLTSHHFMNPAELRTEVGQARLAACVFRLPYKGEMVPMCQMNADGVRERFYAGITAGEMELEPAERRPLPVVH